MPKHIEPANDEQALDELAVEPTPRIVSENDIPLDETSLPPDLPGRASSTPDDLEALFDGPAAQHIADGFTGSGDEDGDHISQNDADDTPDSPEHPAGA